MNKVLVVCWLLMACGEQLWFDEGIATEQKQTLLWTMDISSDDKWIAVGGDDSTLRIFESRTQKLWKEYPVNGMIRQLKWHPTNHRLAIATSNDHIGILNITDSSYIPLAGINSGARGIGWNFNGELLATADNDGLVKIWTGKGDLLRSIKKQDSNSYFSIDWHPFENRIVVSGDDIRIMDTAGTTLQVIKPRKENTGILAVRWHPSGQFFASGDYGHQQEGIPSLLQFWQPDGKLIKSITGSKAEYRNMEWNKDGSLLATASDALRIWNKSGDLLYTGVSKNLLWGIAWNSTSTLLVTTSIIGDIQVWDATAKLKAQLFY